jgi:hypothetical protein
VRLKACFLQPNPLLRTALPYNAVLAVSWVVQVSTGRTNLLAVGRNLVVIFFHDSQALPYPAQNRARLLCGEQAPKRYIILHSDFSIVALAKLVGTKHRSMWPRVELLIYFARHALAMTPLRQPLMDRKRVETLKIRGFDSVGAIFFLALKLSYRNMSVRL